MANRIDGNSVLAYTGVRATTPPQMIVMKRAPTSTDVIGYVLGTQWLYYDPASPQDATQYVLSSVAESTAVWVPLNQGGDEPTLTNHAVVLGTGVPGFNTVGPDSVSGIPLISQGSSADPIFGTATVGGGGTGQTALTAHYTLVGNATSAVTMVAPSSTAGIPYVSNGSSADPSFSTAVVAGGGTGVVTMTTPYAPVCAGTTATGNLQVASTGMSNSGYVLTSNGSSALPSWQANSSSSGFTSINVQTFTTPGTFTYTPTAGISYAIVECVGGGGGGGSLNAPAANGGASSGGGAGGYCRKNITAAAIGVSQSVTVGGGGAGGVGSTPADGATGGNTTFGAILTANGGVGGPGVANPTSSNPQIGALGGTASGGDINIPGQSGGYSLAQGTPNLVMSGSGGSGMYGAGGNSVADANGNDGLGYGAGGSGGSSFNGSGARNGGAGSSGIIIVTEYIT